MLTVEGLSILRGESPIFNFQSLDHVHAETIASVKFICSATLPKLKKNKLQALLKKTLFSVLPGAYYFMYEGNSQIELKRFTSVYWHAIQ